MILPVEIAEILASSDADDSASMRQAFPLLTVSDSGHPHVYLLSTAQLDVVDDTILVSVAGRTTRNNLHARGLATLVAVEGVTAYYLKSRLLSVVDGDGREGFALTVEEVRRDSAGVELSPLSFRFAATLPVKERWATDEAVLSRLRDTLQQGAGTAPGDS